MIFAGGAIAISTMIVVGAATRAHETRVHSAPAPDRSALAASILFNLLLLGGVAPDEALREIRRRAGLAAPVTREIDVASWGDRFAQAASPQQRRWLLETAVQLIAGRERVVPLRQYAALLDLTFSLGFQTDALARLREQYGFDYVDHAKDARPRSADRGGGAMPLFVRGSTETTALLRILGLEAGANRQAIISAYRKLASQHHPDRVHGEPDDIQSEAAAKFIQITRAYETLMAIYRD